MQKYIITFVGWNAAHPHREVLGTVWARNEVAARLAGYRQWPCGNGQTYEARLAR